MSKISVLGAGGWGLALSLVAVENKNEVTVWSPFESEVAELCTAGESKKLLPGVKIPSSIKITTDLSLVDGSDIVIIATPSFAVRETARRLSSLKNIKTVVCVSKGIEYSSLLTLSEVIDSELPSANIVTLSGPSHAEEVARGVETSLVAASENNESALLVQSAMANDKLRIYTNDDVLGVELGGAFKNIIAIAAGICDGMELGDNTRAALMTRGLTEMARLGVRMGAREQTFAGLTGMGDLIVTCTSRHSRNHRFGELLGKGVSVAEALNTVGTVEGYYAAAAANRLREKYGVSLPIIEQSYKVMYENLSAKEAVRALMTRPNRPEIDDSWIK